MNERATEFFVRTTPWLFVAAGALMLAGCERPPIETQQTGFRGVAMEVVVNPRIAAAKAAANVVPAAIPPVPSDGPKAKDIYQNVQVLGDLSVGEFTRLMVAISNWVAPEQQCAYCHKGDNFAADDLYTKVVSRKMLQMTQHINANWTQHVAQTGVTCYTCHRGKPVPENVWFTLAPSPQSARMTGGSGEYAQNKAFATVGTTSMPADPFTSYLLNADAIRVIGTTALPTGNDYSIQHTERTYGLMIHMSEGLGVNCTFCHNSRSFKEWSSSPPQRLTAWHGIRMAREVNNEYMVPLTDVFPADRRGELGDVAKVNCATCHNGLNKPLGGVSMLKDHPELIGKKAPATTASAGMQPVVMNPAGGAATLYFAVNSAQLDAQAATALKSLAQSAGAGGRFVISGYHSASGTLAQNQELAKRRAFAVRDALKSAGIDERRIELRKPQQTSANEGGESASARRVEVAVAR
jgi:photosynthetic reaction center cytochrome c subunit